MAATTNWSDIVPNFDSMPDAMQQWLTTNLPTFISQAIQDGLQQGFDQHWGVAATGNSYHLVGTDHTHAVMGDHNEVVGGQTTRTRQDSVMTHNLADEIKVTEGAHSHQVNSDTFYLTLGTENRTVASHHATEVGGDHSLVVSGNSAAVAATHTVITGSGNTDDSVVTHSETITGSRYEAVSGTHYIQSGVVVRSVGGPLPTNFTAPTLPPPPSKSNPNGLSDGALAHPGLAQELAPAAPAAAMQSSSQQATTQNSAAQQQKSSAAGTKQSKTALNDANMVWQDVAGGAAGIVTSGLALSSSSDSISFVESTNYKGSVQENIEGERITTVEKKNTDSFLGGADSFTKGSASDTVLGMAGDTIIGLSSDALIGLAMPFTLISMGQVLLNMDEDVCVVESKAFKLDMAGMKITTPGGATWGGKAAAEATKVEKAEKLIKDAEEVTKAATEAKAALVEAEKTMEAFKAAKDGVDAAKRLASEAETALGEATKASEALKVVADAKEAERVSGATSLSSKSPEELRAFSKLTVDAREAAKAAETGKTTEAAAKLAKDAADLKTVEAEAKLAEMMPKVVEPTSLLGKASKAIDKAFAIVGETRVGKFLNMGADSTKMGALMKTLVKGGDWAKLFGGTDKALLAVKLTKATVKSVTKGLSVMNRNQVADNQINEVKIDPKTKEVDGKEKPTP